MQEAEERQARTMARAIEDEREHRETAKNAGSVWGTLCWGGVIALAWYQHWSLGWFIALGFAVAILVYWIVSRTMLKP